MILQSYKLFIDTGGTFTDCIAIDQNENYSRVKVLSNSTLRGNIKSVVSARKLVIEENWNLKKDIIQGFHFKLLQIEHETVIIERYNPATQTLYLADSLPSDLLDSAQGFEIAAYEEAPVLGARILTQTPLSEKLPTLHMKLGSTKGTNALLEKKGSKTALFLTKGFKDILHIGDQQRPDIFAQNVEKPLPVPEKYIEVEERIDSSGNVLKEIYLEGLDEAVSQLLDDGYSNAAVVFMNAYQNNQHEQLFKNFLLERGFAFVTASTDLSDHIKYLHRAETAAVNAYLTPVISQYLENIKKTLHEGFLHVMTSAGGLVKAEDFYPKDSLLSGPAGGVVGATQKGIRSGFPKVITFDMGGTSTDVSRFDGQYEYRFELSVGDARIFSPAIAIETVAAGGGSICYFDGFKLCVGPESAGAHPGPACYGAGGPLCITDINLLAGKMDIQRFGIPVFKSEAEKKLEQLIDQIYQATGERRNKESLINGFLEIANETMAGAIGKISVAKGYDPSQYALVGFGGAGGLHACSIADLLGMKTVLVPADAGLLSAYGISKALIERFAEKQILKPLKDVILQLPDWFEELEQRAVNDVAAEDIAAEEIEVRQRLIYLRFQGQDSSEEIPFHQDLDTTLKQFREKYEQVYGYWPEERELEVEFLRVIASARQEHVRAAEIPDTFYKPSISHHLQTLTGPAWKEIPVYDRESLQQGARMSGPAIILDRYSTTYLPDGWKFLLNANETMVLQKDEAFVDASLTETMQTEEAELELFTNRFMFIAENMGAMLQRTSLSVNVKERLDFSCALLDADGNLVANAPHIPVHLGSLGVCVKELKKHIAMEKGDVIITNHPRFGGSHLPDITLVSPVFTDQNELVGYVVNRSHHAEIGGITPASMPPDARSLGEEGVIIHPSYLVKNHRVMWDHIRSLLIDAPYPTRKIEENLADLHAALAANRNGENALRKLIHEHGLAKVRKYMELLKAHAAGKMKQTLRKLGAGTYRATEYLDDGTPLEVSVEVTNDSCIIDFSGSGKVHPGNLNATYAIVNSVVIYVLRLLINEPIPLNDGIFEPVKLIVPRGLLNPDFPDDPEKCPAIVGGNVEVSQRLTDTLLKAFGLLACSQGTMNNVMFGNESFSYYETICGGCGAGKNFHGTSAVHHHMTNTRITDPEIMEHRYPVRLEKFEIREKSGGTGKYIGGDGVIRIITFLEEASLSILSQHRNELPYGLLNGEAGKKGEQWIRRRDGSVESLNGIDGATMEIGDQFEIHTPGGGGYGKST
jgi:5-oxoprolinase (ATP-hydrolysing)